MSFASKITQLFAVCLISVSLFSSLNAHAATSNNEIVPSYLAAITTCAPVRDLPTFSCYGTIPNSYTLPVTIKAKLSLNKGVKCHYFDMSRTFACDNIPVTHLSYNRLVRVSFSVNNAPFEKTNLKVMVQKM